METEQNPSVTCPLHKFLVRGEGVAWLFAPGTFDWWFRSLKGMVSEFGDSMKMLVTSRKMGWGIVIQSVIFPIKLCLGKKCHISGS